MKTMLVTGGANGLGATSETCLALGLAGAATHLLALAAIEHTHEVISRCGPGGPEVDGAR